MWFKPKQKKEQSAYSLDVKRVFSINNLFVLAIQDLIQTYKKSNLLDFINKAANDNYFKELYLHEIRKNEEVFILNFNTKEHLKLILDTYEQVTRCMSIIKSNNSDRAELLINKLVNVVYPLKELDCSIRAGVPLEHPTIVDAIASIHKLLEETLNEYYELSISQLDTEIEIAKQIRLQYEKNRELVKQLRK